MQTKNLKFIGIAAIMGLGLGVASIGQASVVIVRQPPPRHIECTYYQTHMVCYVKGHPQKYYPYSTKRICDSHGICYWQNCYRTSWGKVCRNFYPHRVY